MSLDNVEKLIKEHVSVQPKSGREATTAFEQGQGDVLISEVMYNASGAEPGTVYRVPGAELGELPPLSETSCPPADHAGIWAMRHLPAPSDAW